MAAFRGAVRPPFIEAGGRNSFVNLCLGFGGQSAPPSLKQWVFCACCFFGWGFRGAVRPPFIEAVMGNGSWGSSQSFGGQSAPPSLKPLSGKSFWGDGVVSGGSPPPLH